MIFDLNTEMRWSRVWGASWSVESENQAYSRGFWETHTIYWRLWTTCYGPTISQEVLCVPHILSSHKFHIHKWRQGIPLVMRRMTSFRVNSSVTRWTPCINSCMITHSEAWSDWSPGIRISMSKWSCIRYHTELLALILVVHSPGCLTCRHSLSHSSCVITSLFPVGNWLTVEKVYVCQQFPPTAQHTVLWGTQHWFALILSVTWCNDGMDPLFPL